LKLDPHPAFHNAIAFEYWFGLISFATGEKPLLQDITAKTRHCFLFLVLIGFKAAYPYWVVETTSSSWLNSMGASDCLTCTSGS
jgi:hypothetical protein